MYKMLGSSRLGELNDDLFSSTGRSSKRYREDSNGITKNSSLENEVKKQAIV